MKSEPMSDVSLNTLLPGDKGTIQQINTPTPNVRRRLMEMGLLKGTPIELIRFAPMGDPLEVRVRGFRLSLRKIEAEAVLVRRDSNV